MSRDELVFIVCAGWCTLMAGLTWLLTGRVSRVCDVILRAAMQVREDRDATRRLVDEAAALVDPNVPEPDVIPLPVGPNQWSDPDWEVDPEPTHQHDQGNPVG